MTHTSRERVFASAVALVFLGNLLWFVINILEGATIIRAVVDLAWHFAVLILLSIFLWRSRSNTWGVTKQ